MKMQVWITVDVACFVGCVASTDEYDHYSPFDVIHRYMDNVHKSGRQTSGQSKNMFSNERVLWYEGLWGPPNAVEYPRYGTIRSLKEGRKRQQALDEEFSSKLRWPRWFLYHYPKWSIGHGLMTTGERRRLVTFYDYQVHYGRCLVLLVLYVMVPICVLLPLSFTGVVVDLDPTNIVAVNVIFIFAFGYPVGYFLFYVSRAVWSIVPKAVRACIPIVCVHFFVFVVIPLGGIYPVYSSRKLFFHSDVALFCDILIYALPVSFAALWGVVFLVSEKKQKNTNGPSSMLLWCTVD